MPPKAHPIGNPCAYVPSAHLGICVPFAGSNHSICKERQGLQLSCLQLSNQPAQVTGHFETQGVQGMHLDPLIACVFSAQPDVLI